MTDSKEAKGQRLGPLDEEELIAGGTRYFIKGLGFRPTYSFKDIAGGPGHGSRVLMLQLLFLVLFTVILVVVLVKGRLCRPCSWDWTLFQRNCYFFSNSKLNWSNSVTACQEMRAQLVVIKSVEEQNFLQLSSKNRGPTWMGLSDLKKEGVWHWLDGSHLWFRFTKYWLPGEPNNDGKEDCAEFRGDGWNDGKCEREKFWICKKPAASCSNI
ncbi:PREDICTED: CD209 antigen-like protein 2 isoform X2 [Chinchilla lanigera]|uniref:CD209 antigen-like protein 2 isoform X2 n=1 Tax=Chinchilla lanigera TaxID=34839 RepID=UPI00038EBB12|nr:PREDICTED: CD209 antigen-like protein 2 isoform X2 [Chinchilla lanigera]